MGTTTTVLWDHQALKLHYRSTVLSMYSNLVMGPIQCTCFCSFVYSCFTSIPIRHVYTSVAPILTSVSVSVPILRL